MKKGIGVVMHKTKCRRGHGALLIILRMRKTASRACGIFVVLMLLLSIGACGVPFGKGRPDASAPSSASANPGIFVSEGDIPEERALYEAYLESNEWAWLQSMEESRGLENYNEGNCFEISAKMVLDFDGDGILDFYFVATNPTYGGPRGNMEISCFCTILEGKVEKLLWGYASGGSIGGSFVSSAYSEELAAHVLRVGRYDGGWGGWATENEFYSMNNGKLTKLDQFLCMKNGYSDAEEQYAEEHYEVNGEIVGEEVFLQATTKYTDPIDTKYALERGAFTD